MYLGVGAHVSVGVLEASTLTKMNLTSATAVGNGIVQKKSSGWGVGVAQIDGVGRSELFFPYLVLKVDVRKHRPQLKMREGMNQ